MPDAQDVFRLGKQFILYMVRVKERIQSYLGLWIGIVTKSSTQVDGAVRADKLIVGLEASLF